MSVKKPSKSNHVPFVIKMVFASEERRQFFARDAKIFRRSISKFFFLRYRVIRRCVLALKIVVNHFFFATVALQHVLTFMPQYKPKIVDLISAGGHTDHGGMLIEPKTNAVNICIWQFLYKNEPDSALREDARNTPDLIRCVKQ